jgi:diaminopimelate decarboxylase/aspartate kinase
MSPSYIVTKFGGKSVSELRCWQTINAITKAHLQQGLRPVIICSAVSGITDLLEQLLVVALKHK